MKTSVLTYVALPSVATFLILAFREHTTALFLFATFLFTIALCAGVHSLYMRMSDYALVNSKIAHIQYLLYLYSIMLLTLPAIQSYPNQGVTLAYLAVITSLLVAFFFVVNKLKQSLLLGLGAVYYLGLFIELLM